MSAVVAEAGAGMTSHIWVELIAFDVEAEDLGVAAYLADVGHVPSTLSLLTYSVEFLHGHVDSDDDTELPIECTSYGARPRAARGPRQNWTQGQLRRLVALLRARDMAVLFAVFDLHGYPTADGMRISRFSQEHPELTVRDRSAQRRTGMINPLSRRRDGLRYADWFVADLKRVMAYYGFSGWHAADGFTSTRLPLWLGDFSQNFVALFAERFPGLVPDGLLTGDDPEQVVARADLVWGAHRAAWIEYHAERFAELWTAAVDVVHSFGGIVVANNGWTRDPFESLYRHGSDYDRMVTSGIDAVVLESSAAAIQLIEAGGDESVLAWVTATAMLGRLHLGSLPLRPLIGVHDWYEGWDVIADARPLLQRDIFTVGTPRQVTSDGRSTRCISGILWCLGDGITADQWQWLDAQRVSLGQLSFVEEPTPTLVYDPSGLSAQLRSFEQDQTASTGRLLERLLLRGADLTRVTTPDVELDSRTPVVVLRGDLQPAAIAAARRHHSYAILSTESGKWVLYQATGGQPEHRITAGSVTVPADADLPVTSWTQELAMAEPDPELMGVLTSWINDQHQSDRPLRHLTRRLDAEGSEVAMINNSPHYAVVAWPDRHAVITGISTGTVLRHRDLQLGDRGGVTIQIPPGGVSVIRVEPGKDGQR